MAITLDTLIKAALHNNPELKTGQIQTEIKNIEIILIKYLL